MLVTSLIIAAKTLRSRPAPDETITRHILPVPFIVTVILVAAYAVLLKPLGFLPTSFLFIVILIRLLGRMSLVSCAAISAASVLLIYLVFRVIFTVVMPEGIVPEREIMAWIGKLLSGGQ
jgi:putative tricarboxylic transport membrane protein